MPRAHAAVRDAVPEDAEALLSIWSDFARPAGRQGREVAEPDTVRRAVAKITDDPSQRLVVAVSADGPVGVAHLRRAPLSPIHDEDAVHIGYLHVLSSARRRGLGHLLMETAAEWADDIGTKHIVASVGATARESNRFLARLGMSQVAVVRATTVTALRSRLRATLHHPLRETVAFDAVAPRRLVRFSVSRGSAGR